MITYRLIVNSDSIEKTDLDGTISTVPNDLLNLDWKVYLAWLAEGNTPLASAF